MNHTGALTDGQSFANEIILKIKEARKAEGLSQTAVAARLGMSQNAYSKIELLQTKLMVGHLILLSEILGRPVGDFIPARGKEY